MLLGSRGSGIAAGWPCPTRRRPALTRRRCLRPAAFWTPPWGGSEGETDDEILTAAAVAERGGGRGQSERNAKRGVLPAGTAEEPAPRVTLPAFAASLAFITVGAFFVGSAIRRYILQPADLPDGRADFGSNAKRRAGAGGRGGPAVPSVRDLLGRRADAPGNLSSGDEVLSTAAVQSSLAAGAAAAAAAAAEAEAAAAAAAASCAEAASAATEAAAAAASTAAEAAQAAAAQPVAAAADPATEAAATAAQADAAGGAGVASLEAAEVALVGGQADADAAGEQRARQPGDADWCSAILEPALRAATAAKHKEKSDAAAEAAAAKQAAHDEAAAVAAAAAAATAAATAPPAAVPLLACRQLWALTQQAAEGPVLLRLLFPVAGGGEENCLALLQDEADAEALQRTLSLALGLPTRPAPLPTAGVVATAAQQGWAAAFFPGGSLAASLAAVQDAAEQQEQVEAERRAQEPASGEAEEAPDVADLLFAVLQQQARLVGSDDLRAAAAGLRAALAPAGPQAPQQAPQQAAAAERAAEPTQAQAPAQQPGAQQQTAAAPPRVPATDPWWEEQTRRRPPAKLDPDWWLSLPVVHVPQLSYGDGGAKGLMTVPICVPESVQSVPGATHGGGGASPEGTVCERRLVAFAELQDAEALAECDVAQSEAGVAGVQVISVPPAQLAAHAQANACGVAVLPAGDLRLPANAGYDAAVGTLVDAVEKRFLEEVLHRAYARLLEAAATQAMAGQAAAAQAAAGQAAGAAAAAGQAAAGQAAGEAAAAEQAAAAQAAGQGEAGSQSRAEPPQAAAPQGEAGQGAPLGQPSQ